MEPNRRAAPASTLRRCSGLIIGSSNGKTACAKTMGCRTLRLHGFHSVRCRGVAGRFARGRANQAWNFGFDAGRRLAWPYRHPPEGTRCPAQSVEGRRSQRPGGDVLLMLIGSGPDAELFDEEIRKATVPHIVWHRDYILTDPARRDYLSAAEITFSPRDDEGFPVAPLEAMACRLPIVAASAPGINDILNGGEKCGGLVVPTGDAATFAANLGRLLDNESECRRFGARARARVEQGVSLEAVEV